MTPDTAYVLLYAASTVAAGGAVAAFVAVPYQRNQAGAFVYTDPVTGERLRIDFPSPKVRDEFAADLRRCADLIDRFDGDPELQAYQQRLAAPATTRDEFAERMALLNPLVYGWNRLWTPPRPAFDRPWTYDADGWPGDAWSAAAADERRRYVNRNLSGTFLFDARTDPDALRSAIRAGTLTIYEPPLTDEGWRSAIATDVHGEQMHMWYHPENDRRRRSNDFATVGAA